MIVSVSSCNQWNLGVILTLKVSTHEGTSEIQRSKFRIGMINTLGRRFCLIYADSTAELLRVLSGIKAI